MAMAEDAQRLAPSISQPLLLVQGGADRATSPEAARIFFDAVAARDKEFRLYDGASHALLFEDKGSEAFREISRWLAMHSGNESKSLL